MCDITATELKKNLAHHMTLSAREDIFVTKNGKVVTVLTSPRNRADDVFFSLHGVFRSEGLDESDNDVLGKEIEAHAYPR